LLLGVAKSSFSAPGLVSASGLASGVANSSFSASGSALGVAKSSSSVVLPDFFSARPTYCPVTGRRGLALSHGLSRFSIL